MLHLIVKIFDKCNRVKMCDYFLKGTALDSWAQCFKIILDMQCPPELSSDTKDIDEIDKRNKAKFWKLKGITAKSSYYMFTKYSVPAKIDDWLRPFAKSYMDKHFSPLLESHLQLIFARKTGFVGSKALNYAFKYITGCTHTHNTMATLKPFVNNILYDTIIPLMLITENDIEIFETEPTEYIRDQYSYAET